MGTTQPYHDPGFLMEIWGLYIFGVIIILLRIIVRFRHVGIRNFQGDDYTILLVLACYTADAIGCTMVFLQGSVADYTPQQLARFNGEELAQIGYGSKLQLCTSYSYLTLVWSLKACMLFFYKRLTLGLQAQVYVQAIAITCGLTYAAAFLTITLACHPIHLYWQTLPYPPVQCTLRTHSFYVGTTLNVVTEALMLCIPLPLLRRLQVPIRRKITLALLLSSGVFIMAVALARIVITLTSHHSASTANRWGIRVTIAGIIAINLPILVALLKKDFWTGRKTVEPRARWLAENHHASNERRSTKPNTLDDLSMNDDSPDPSFHTCTSSEPATPTRRADLSSDANESPVIADTIIQDSTRKGSSGYAMGTLELGRGQIGPDWRSRAKSNNVQDQTTHPENHTAGLWQSSHV